MTEKRKQNCVHIDQAAIGISSLAMSHQQRQTVASELVTEISSQRIPVTQ